MKPSKASPAFHAIEREIGAHFESLGYKVRRAFDRVEVSVGDEAPRVIKLQMPYGYSDEQRKANPKPPLKDATICASAYEAKQTAQSYCNDGYHASVFKRTVKADTVRITCWAVIARLYSMPAVLRKSHKRG